ncbi:hypothetical protein FIBSPDRAFT_962732 [Athelia psychrophila]|uniref:DUF6589 domain-containing protein n=1 Tax=Athelia psychrophila TaxID=1759441 RepID=A0A165ZQR7_9AGAM|nr:hypothetical protein FIBSPDRAFT_962732 [Fibularhizoctonia sp. CBS 109695]
MAPSNNPVKGKITDFKCSKPLGSKFLKKLFYIKIKVDVDENGAFRTLGVRGGGSRISWGDNYIFRDSGPTGSSSICIEMFQRRYFRKNKRIGGFEDTIGSLFKEGSSGAFARLARSRSVLRRKVKNADRPNCCPAQHLVFVALKAEVLDCWRVKFGVSDLDQRFSANFEDLLGDARALCQLHISGSLVENAVLPNLLCPDDEDEVPFEGSQVLANTRVRMRDSMLYYEFQRAISDGGIRHAMNVIAARTQMSFSSSHAALSVNARGAHHRTLKKAAMNRLAANMDEQQLHRYREGCAWGYAAQDDLEAGFTNLTSGPKIGDL